MKLNLGCGFRKREGFLNVDVSAGCQPDLQLDLANSQWPWPDSSIEHVTFDFALEQIGETKSHLRHVVRELHRVCAAKAKVEIVSVHPRHDRFALNPLCSHKISPDFLQLLSVQNNLKQIAIGEHETCLGLMWEVNFEIERFKYLLARQFESALAAGPDQEATIRDRLTYENNICEAVEIELRVVKS